MSATRRALLSVSDKSDLIPFAKQLVQLSFELVATGGTARALREAGLPLTEVSEVTGFPELMDGRVKTLHPAIHAGLLARSGIDDDALIEHGLAPIDLLVVNLYPFEATIARPDCSESDAIENIDVGGPAMLRAAAKNHTRTTVVVDSTDYEEVLQAYREGEPPAALKRRLAVKAFGHTASYDAAISSYLQSRLERSESSPDPLIVFRQRSQALRYGENPHQRAALYVDSLAAPGSVAQAKQLQGKPLSFNNLVDADTAMQCVNSLSECACVIVKHANPCGVATDDTSKAAYVAAYGGDPVSAFGGVIAFNRPLDAATADTIIEQQFAEVIAVQQIEDEALTVLAKKPNIRVLQCGAETPGPSAWDIKSLHGGLLLQQRDTDGIEPGRLKTVTNRSASDAELHDLEFAWLVAKFVKSNAIVYAKHGRTVGIGAGQMSRVMSARIAALQAEDRKFSLDGAVMASDAFFPFRDGVDAAAQHGISAVIQPGGSLNDDEVIAAANEHDIAMIFTGQRHFRH